MSENDEDIFRREMGDVEPLPEDDRIPPEQTRGARRKNPSLSQLAHRDSVREQLRDPNPLTMPERIREVGPHDVLGHRKDGVQEGVYRKLRLGKYDIQDKLDLHRIKLREARTLVYEFILSAHQKGLRNVMITHGKGIHSPVPARLKSYVIHWLEEFDLVLAWHTARPEHGGAGATYVMVRKSAEARQRNRERFQEKPRKG